MTAPLRIVPANEARCDDLQTPFGTRGAAAYCRRQRYKLRPPVPWERRDENRQDPTV